MERKRKKQSTSAKLTINQRKLAVELIEQIKTEHHGFKPPTKVEMSRRVAKALKRPISVKTINKLLNEKDKIKAQVEQPKRKGFFRMQSEEMIQWEKEFDEFISEVRTTFFSHKFCF